MKRRRITLDDLRESLKGRVRVDEYLKEQGVLEPEIPRVMEDAARGERNYAPELRIRRPK